MKRETLSNIIHRVEETLDKREPIERSDQIVRYCFHQPGSTKACDVQHRTAAPYRKIKKGSIETKRSNTSRHLAQSGAREIKDDTRQRDGASVCNSITKIEGEGAK